MKFIITHDVECFDFATNSFNEAISSRIEKESLPLLLDLYKRNGVKATFFFTARFSRLSPESVKMVSENGHEIGCHGYDHTDFYDELSFEKQLKMLKTSKKIIEDICQKKIFSFRAPALRINKNTVKALEQTGFKYDSSVASQRFDGPFTSGALKKMKWICAKRNCYKMSYHSPFRAGESSIIEFPVSAIFWPFVGTHMRLSPGITKFVERLLIMESKITGKPLVFLFHPVEVLSFLKGKTVRRGNYFTDNIRHCLKFKNLGNEAFLLMDDLIKRAIKNGAEFKRMDQMKNG